MMRTKWGVVLLAAALAVGCGKKDEEPTKQEPAEEPEVEEPKEEPPPEPPAAGMPEDTVSVIAVLEVENWDAWKKVFDAHAEERKQASAVWHSVSRDVDDENTVYVHVVGTDMDKVKAFVGAEEFKKIMKEGGVKGEPELWLANDVEIDSPEGEVEGETYSVFARHEVEDFDKWKAEFDTDADARSTAMTVIGGSVSRAADDDKMVVLHFTVTDPAKFKEQLESDELEAKMKRGGVKGKPEIRIAKDVEVSMYGS